jgi:hypothetical protein
MGVILSERGPKRLLQLGVVNRKDPQLPFVVVRPDGAETSAKASWPANLPFVAPSVQLLLLSPGSNSNKPGDLPPDEKYSWPLPCALIAGSQADVGHAAQCPGESRFLR